MNVRQWRNGFDDLSDRSTSGMNGSAMASIALESPSEFLELSWTDSIGFSFSLSAIPKRTLFRVSSATGVSVYNLLFIG